jgi:hypothetical protein
MFLLSIWLYRRHKDALTRLFNKMLPSLQWNLLTWTQNTPQFVPVMIHIHDTRRVHPSTWDGSL